MEEIEVPKWIRIVRKIIKENTYLIPKMYHVGYIFWAHVSFNYGKNGIVSVLIGSINLIIPITAIIGSPNISLINAKSFVLLFKLKK